MAIDRDRLRDLPAHVHTERPNASSPGCRARIARGRPATAEADVDTRTALLTAALAEPTSRQADKHG